MGAGDLGATVRVFFRQSGGLAGQIRGCELDDEELGTNEGHQLRDLVDKTGIKASFERCDPRVRDAEVYEIRLDYGAEQVHVRIDEASLTEQYAPLVEYLQSRAEPRELDDPRWQDTSEATGNTSVQGVFFDIGDTLARARWSGEELHLELMPGVVEVLEAFRASGTPLGVLSNTPPGFTQKRMDALLEQCGLLRFFEDDLRIYSSVVDLDKSTPKIFELAAERVARADQPAALLYVGEDADERATAQAAGWRVAPDPALGLALLRDPPTS